MKIRHEFEGDGFNPNERDIEDIRIISEELVKQLIKMDADECDITIEMDNQIYEVNVNRIE